jgi:hypothetical protein
MTLVRLIAGLVGHSFVGNDAPKLQRDLPRRKPLGAFFYGAFADRQTCVVSLQRFDIHQGYANLQFVRTDGLRQRFGGQAVIAGGLIQQAHDVQRRRLPGVEREDLPAEHFRRRFSLAARQCGPAISSAHAASPRAG